MSEKGHPRTDGGVGCGADFAMDFGPVGVGEECVEECVCGLDGVDGVGGQERRKTFLPVVVEAFDFAFCLRRGGVAQGDAIKVESQEVGFCAFPQMPARASRAATRLGATARLAVYPADVGAQVASPQSPILRISTAILPFIPQVPTPFPLDPSLFYF